MRLVKTETKSNCLVGSSLSRLIAELRAGFSDASLKQRMEFIRQYPIHARDVWQYVVLDRRNYHREIVETNDQFQMLVITWLPGQKSAIHNHKDSQCIVRVLSGSAVETVYEPYHDGTFSCNSNVYRTGETVGGEDTDIHSVENPRAATKPLVTLHCYFPVLTQMDVFGIEENQLKRIDLNEFNIQGGNVER